ncbi:MAG: SDR family NAD(P)-dependent oxidoreductase [Myxococcota bacterium]
MSEHAGRVAVVTGSTGGLGGHVARHLAETGWDLILLDRNPDKQTRVLKALETRFPGRSVVGKQVDLLDLETVHAVVEDITTSTPALGALWNIAGLLTDRRISSTQDLEGHFALNTVAPYALMRGLRPCLARAAAEGPASFIVNFTTGNVSRVAQLDVASLSDPPEIGGLMGAYTTSKAALQAAGCALADELKADGILIHAVDPGATKTDMTDGNPGMPFLVRLLRPLLFRPADRQAAKLMRAVEAAVARGDTDRVLSEGKDVPHPAAVRDQAVQQQLRALLDRILE